MPPRPPRDPDGTSGDALSAREGDGSGVPAGSGPAERYEALLDRETRAAEALRLRGRRLVWVRVAVFVLLGLAIVVADPASGAGRPWAWGVAGLLGAVFMGLVVHHGRVRREEAHHEALAEQAELGLARLERAWDRLEEAGLPDGPAEEDDVPEADRPFADDLILFGRVSLFRLLGPVTTGPGRDTLVRWLLGTAGTDGPARSPSDPEPDGAGDLGALDPAFVRARQDAVRALAPEVEWRHDFAARGMGGDRVSPRGLTTFLGWAESRSWLKERLLLRGAAVLLPPVTIVLIGLHLAGGATGALWILPLGLQMWLQRRVEPEIGEAVVRAGAGRAGLDRYGTQLALAHRMPGEAAELRRLRDGLEATGAGVEEALRGLRRRLDFAESRANVFYRALDALVFLDVWVYRSLERWKGRHGAAVRRWLELLGEAEALSALAAVAHDHPGWTFAEMESASGPEPTVDGRAVGHPLLHPDRCVRNDVEIGRPGTFLLVTGSNMSGKSTLLRAVGANAVLALAGAPACADALRLPPVRIRTSMMVGDSLADGVSRFMAELLRLKGVVDAARATGPDDPPVLYLLDEILQGTNTAERRIAARTVLRHLLEARAIGAVTSHDLTLHQADDLEARARTFHFRESVKRAGGEARLHFDYKLRPGLSTTTNALDLLEAVGLGREGEARP